MNGSDAGRIAKIQRNLAGHCVQARPLDRNLDGGLARRALDGSQSE